MFDMELFREANGKIKEVFLLSNVIIQRIRQIQEGSDPLVEHDGDSTVNIALKELGEGKIEARKEEMVTGQDLFAQPE
jgi:DNA-directed RNA polymerase subunit K/omega